MDIWYSNLSWHYLDRVRWSRSLVEVNTVTKENITITGVDEATSNDGFVVSTVHWKVESDVRSHDSRFRSLCNDENSLQVRCECWDDECIACELRVNHSDSRLPSFNWRHKSLFYAARSMLAGGTIDVELTSSHYHVTHRPTWLRAPRCITGRS